MLAEIIQFFNSWKHIMIIFFIMIATLGVLIFFIKKIVFSTLNNILQKNNQAYLNLAHKYHLYNYVLHTIVSLYFIFWGHLLQEANIFSSLALLLKTIVITIYTTISINLLLLAIINIIQEALSYKTFATRIPVGLYAQILKTFLIISAIIIIISYIFNISLTSFFTSLGAAAALLGFIFKDTLLGMFASLQLTLQDIIRIGDWITVPKHEIDGDVESITITVTKIRNFDKTISTIPTQELLATTIKNWRGMKESGGRRIKRALYIDMSSIQFCSAQLIERIKKLPYMTEIIDNIMSKTLDDENITNIGLFRAYTKEYLKHHMLIHNDSFTLLVRQLAPTSSGLPIELYIFTTRTDWSEYEDIQADIFDHLISIVSKFDLKIFQYYGDY